MSFVVVAAVGHALPRGIEPGCWEAAVPWVGQSHYFSGKRYIFGQKPAAKNEKKYFFYLLNEKDRIHSAQRGEVAETRDF